MSTIREGPERRRNEAEELLGRGLDARALADILDEAPEAIAISQQIASGVRDYVVLYCNREFERFYGADRASVVGSRLTSFFASRASPEEIASVLDRLQLGKPFSHARSYEVPGSDDRIWMEVLFRPIGDRRLGRWVGMTRDLTAAKRDQQRMEQLTTAIEQGSDPVAISVADDRVWRFSYVNEAFVRVTGFLQAELIGQPWEVLLSLASERKRFDDIRTTLYSGQRVRTELPFRHKDGRLGVFEANLQPLPDPITKNYASIVSVFRDITEMKQREQALLFQAEHDLLTGLHNRRYLARTIELAIAMTGEQPSHMLLFIDLDGFKNVNDEFGHDAGDAVLVAAARAFQSHVFQSDVLTRWGGDEFAAVLFHCNRESGLRVAQSMLDALEREPDRQGVTASIGITAIERTDTLHELIRRADRACYSAKAAGRNQVLIG